MGEPGLSWVSQVYHEPGLLWVSQVGMGEPGLSWVSQGAINEAYGACHDVMMSHAVMNKVRCAKWGQAAASGML